MLLFRDIIASLSWILFGVTLLITTNFDINVSENFYAFIQLVIIWIVPVVIIVTSVLMLLINISVIWVRLSFILLPDQSRSFIDWTKEISFNSIGIYILKGLIRLTIASFAPWIIYLVILYINKSTTFFITYDWLLYLYLSPYIVSVTIIYFFIHYYIFIILLKSKWEVTWLQSFNTNNLTKNKLIGIWIFFFIILIGSLLFLFFWMNISNGLLFWKITAFIWFLALLNMVIVYYWDYYASKFHISNGTRNFIEINIILSFCILLYAYLYNSYSLLMVYAWILSIVIITMGFSSLLNFINIKLKEFLQNFFK